MTDAYKKKKAKKYAQAFHDIGKQNRCGYPIGPCCKISYPSATKARRAVHRTNTTGKDKPVESFTSAQRIHGIGWLNEYYCETCKAWHIGNTRPVKSKETTRA